MDLSRLEINARVFGVPLRIAPSFWLLCVFLSPFMHPQSGEERPWIFGAVGWLVAALLSFLIHEFGHALAARALFNAKPAIELGIGASKYGRGSLFGGLTTWRAEGASRSPGKLALVSFAGPGAALFAALALVGVALLTGCRVAVAPYCGVVPVVLPLDWLAGIKSTSAARLFVGYFVYGFVVMNFLWTALNLLPIFPLDGGQIVMSLTSKLGFTKSVRLTLTISLASALAVAALFGIQRNWFSALIFFGAAVMNYRALQSLNDA